MTLINDDPIIRSMERTGYPPWWHQPDYPDSMFEEGEDDEDAEDEEKPFMD